MGLAGGAASAPGRTACGRGPCVQAPPEAAAVPAAAAARCGTSDAGPHACRLYE